MRPFLVRGDAYCRALSTSLPRPTSDRRDREGQPRGPEDNHIVFAKVGEPDKQLLVLFDAARIVGDNHRLPHSFDTQGLAEGAVRVECASEFA